METETLKEKLTEVKAEALCDALADWPTEEQAETPLHAPVNTLAEEKAKAQDERTGNMEAKTLVKALDNIVTRNRGRDTKPTLAKVKAKALVNALAYWPNEVDSQTLS